MKKNKYKEIYNEELKRNVLHVWDKHLNKWVRSAGERMNEYPVILATTPVKDNEPTQAPDN